MMIRKGQLTALAAAMLLCACASTNQTGMKDGTYTEVVPGHNAPMTVKVTIKDNRITAIDTSKTSKRSAWAKSP